MAKRTRESGKRGGDGGAPERIENLPNIEGLAGLAARLSKEDLKKLIEAAQKKDAAEMSALRKKVAGIKSPGNSGGNAAATEGGVLDTGLKYTGKGLKLGGKALLWAPVYALIGAAALLYGTVKYSAKAIWEFIKKKGNVGFKDMYNLFKSKGGDKK